jgi:hypothetical protein
MTLKIFVAKDSKGQPWALDTTHESKACEWMLRKAWQQFHHLQEMHAILVNLRHPSADMVVMTERGLGILELKHKFGEITINPQGSWMAGRSQIEAGAHLNPREQVRSYARELRKELGSWILPGYMRTKKEYWDKLKFQTGVCFTHPDAKIQKAQKYIEARRPSLEPWESNFSIIDIDRFTPWIRQLRFELKHDRRHTNDFEPVRLPPDMIVRIARDALGTLEWTDIYPSMPGGKPYGCLILNDAEGEQAYNLVTEYYVLGRSHESDIVISERYSRVSKKHCAIARTMDGVEVVDLDSRNGTYINGRSVKKSALHHGDRLFLGGNTAKEKVCALKFEMGQHASLDQITTEEGTLFSKRRR